MKKFEVCLTDLGLESYTFTRKFFTIEAEDLGEAEHIVYNEFLLCENDVKSITDIQQTLKEISIHSDSRYTILHDGERHCLVPTDNDNILLKSGSLQDCMFFMEQLKKEYV